MALKTYRVRVQIRRSGKLSSRVLIVRAGTPGAARNKARRKIGVAKITSVREASTK